MASVTQKEIPAALAAPLTLDVEQIKGELVLAEPQIPSEDDPVRAKARKQVETIIAIKPEQYNEAKAAIDAAGLRVLQASSHRSEMLKGRLSDLKDHAQEGSPIAKALLDLRDQVAELDPAGVSFTKPWWVNWFGWLFGNPLSNYFDKFETGQGVIDKILKSCESGKAMLENDNRILGQDQAAYREVTEALKSQIEYLQAVVEEFKVQIHSITDDAHKQFIETEILFPLQQRVQDLFQRLAVNQQGVISAEILIRTNRELIRGVERALFVTADALNIAVATALALNNQKLVLDAVTALNDTTNSLIASNAKRIGTQGVQVMNQASSSMLDQEVLRQSFKDLSKALDDIASFRREALPKMSEDIVAMQADADAADKKIAEMEAANVTIEAFDLDLIDAAEAA